MENFELPHNLTAEKAFIASAILSPDLLSEISDVGLMPDDLYQEKYQLIYDAILTLHDKRDAIDFVTVTSVLKNRGDLERIGGEQTIIDITDSLGSSAFIEEYAKEIKNNSRARKIMNAGTKLTKLGKNYLEAPEEIFNQAEAVFVELTKERNQNKFIGMRDATKRLFRYINDRLGKSEIIGLSTGFKEIDRTLLGLQAGQMIVIAARPSVGKTTFALNIALNTAVKHRVNVAIFSLEMSLDELTSKLLSSYAEIPLYTIKTANFKHDQYNRLAKMTNDFTQLPIFIDDTGGQNIHQIRSKARQLKLQDGLGLIMIDYLQIMGMHTKFANKADQIGEISKAIKALAKELEVPIIVLAQNNREGEKDEGKKRAPRLSDIRDSGSIEADADVVMFIDRDKSMDSNPSQLTKIHIAKNRNGELGEVTLTFDGKTSRFIEKSN